MKLETFSGAFVDTEAPHHNDIHGVDIAHALGMLCRFGGHVQRFYSVAEHCVHMHDYCVRNRMSQLVAFEALVHDAAEAYVGDVVFPVKRMLPDFKRVEAAFKRAIRVRYVLPEEMTPDVAAVVGRLDRAMLALEAKHLQRSGGVGLQQHATEPPLEGVHLGFWSPVRAKMEFLDLLHRYAVYETLR